MKKLSLIERAFFLKRSILFNDLDLDLLIAIADKMHQDIYEKNERVFELNQIANKMYFVAKGSVNIVDENNNILKTLTKNDFFGDESLFNENPRAYSVYCLENSILMSLNKINLHTILSECPSVAISLLSSYAKTTKHRY